MTLGRDPKLDERRRGLSDAQRAWLEARLRGASSVGSVRPIRRCVRDGRIVPLSVAQTRLWFLERYEPDSPVYNMAGVIESTGTLRQEGLLLAFSEVRRRHEVLRSVIVEEGGIPGQRVQSGGCWAPASVDLSGLAEADRGRVTERLARDCAQATFSLGKGPLWRCAVIRRSACESSILIAMHHIISDGWSIDLMFNELGSIYRRGIEGQPSELDEPALQYGDVAQWQRQAEFTALCAGQVAHWREALAGVPELLELPSDRPRPALMSYRGRRHCFSIPAEFTSGLRRLAQDRGVSLFHLLLATLNVVLFRVSGQNDLCVGTPVAGRTREETEKLLGCFVNILVLRTRIDREQPFCDLLARVRELSLCASAHQDVPFERIVDELHPARSLSYAPLFQVMLAFQPAALRELDLPGVVLRPRELDVGVAKFDLTLDVEDAGAELRVALEYNVDLFNATTAARLAGLYARVLGEVLRDPSQRVEELAGLDGPERHLATIEWQDTGVDFEPEASMVELVERAVRRWPERTAIVCGDEHLTYGALDRRATLVAQRLGALGVGPDVLVGVATRRSPELVVAWLAVLKAGGAYVPIDPSHPVEHLRLLVEEAQLSVVVVERREDLPAELPAVLVSLSDLDEGRGGERSGPAARPGDLIYAVFTSGSTGRPKGTLNGHWGLVNLVGQWQRLAHLRPGDRMTMVAAPVFDAAAAEVWPALSSGATLCLTAEETRRSPPQMQELLARDDIAVSWLPTPLFEAMWHGGWGGTTSLRCLSTAGDRLHRTPRVRPGLELLNLYGPTETSVMSNQAVLNGRPEDVPVIGRPVANCSTPLLDEALEPVALGAKGELCIIGRPVGRGYLGRLSQTAACFVCAPHRVGETTYRTGDITRHVPDGSVEFLGRADHQVKVRGFRIELGEIEAALGRFPGVREVVVVARADVPERKQLVAYVGWRDELRPDPATLRAFLAEHLPEYMIPTVFVFLPDLPHTATGKVNRRALPAPEHDQAADGEEPRSATERAVAGIWSSVLGVQRIGRTSDFFALGGHSLLATQVAVRVRDQFGVELPLRSLFDRPTLKDLASFVDEAQGVHQARIPRLARGGETPLSPAQERLWFLDQYEPESPFYSVPVTVRLEGAQRPEVLRAALGEIWRRHDVLRATFVTVTSGLRQRAGASVPLALPVVDLTALAAPDRERTAAMLVRHDGQRPFDLTSGPLLRAAVLRLTPQESIVSCNLHHIVTDGWSVGVMVNELGHLYGCFANGDCSSLPELMLQYADVAVWQRQRLEGRGLEAEAGYWREALRGVPPLLELPTDRARPAIQTFHGQTWRFDLSAALSSGVDELAQREGVTPFMVLLAAFQVLLGRLSGQEDICVGSPIAGRARQELEPLIGLFVNTLVLRGDLRGNPDFAELLARTRERTLGAYAHQELPFERLVELVQPERSLSYSPLFQVMLVLQNAPGASLELPGVKLSPVDVETGVAKCDLTLTFWQEERVMRGSVEFNTDLFAGSTIRRLVGQFRSLLQTAVESPATRIGDLPLHDSNGPAAFSVEWNDTAGPYDRQVCVHTLFERQVALNPDRIAVVCGDEHLSYGELERRAESLAAQLRGWGVGPETLVAVIVRRGPQVPEMLLAVLKAGAAYVPVDPQWPTERVRGLLDGMGAPVVLTEAALRGSVEAAVAGLAVVPKVVCVDQPWSPTGRGAVSAATPDGLAYVIFTSGSTGVPKGVMVRHRAAVNLVEWVNRTESVGSNDRLLFVTSLCFDLSVYDLFGTLAAGGCVRVATSRELKEPATLLRIIREEQITFWDSAPAFMQQVVEARPEGVAGESLRLVYLSGDWIPVGMPDTLRAMFPAVRVISLGGATEATVWSNWYPIGAVARSWRSIPYGRPISNARYHVLDREGGELPPLAPGELFIAGDCLADNYLGGWALNARKFAPDAIGGAPGQRLYDTGDQARYFPDGNLEFLGRVDSQVKVRGYRIELGDIEAALRDHPSVGEVVVVVREDVPGQRRLVAYLVAARAGTTAAELKAHAAARLPEYMVPPAFVFLPALPVTPNGKLDRKALPPTEVGIDAASEFVPPRNDTEAALARIWCEVLQRARVGVTDDFFALGGDSLLATRVLGGIRKELGVELPMRRLFETVTIAGLAELIEATRRGDDRDEGTL